MNSTLNTTTDVETVAEGTRRAFVPPPLPPLATAVATGAEPHSHVPTHYPSRTGMRALIFAIVIVVALIAIFGLRHALNARADAPLAADLAKAAHDPIALDVIHVRKGEAEKPLTLPGEARPFCESTIYARTSGYLGKYSVDIGDHVTAGQELATIKTPELDDQIASASAKIRQLDAEVHVVETSATFAKLSFDRWAASSGDGAVSVQERDQKKSELDSTLAKLQAAKEGVALAKADRQRLLTMDTFKVVVAPFKGTITDRRVDTGDLISAGSTSNTTALFCIAQSDPMRVFVDVPQAVAPEITKDMLAVASYGGHDFPGRVDRTAETINLSSRTLKVEVLVPNPQHLLLPGTYLQVTLKFERPSVPLQIPSSALVWRSSGPQAAVVDKEGRVKFRPITITRDMGDLVEIVGLNENERVALNIGSQASDGEIVQARDVDAPPIPVKDAPVLPSADVASHKVAGSR